MLFMVSIEGCQSNSWNESNGVLLNKDLYSTCNSTLEYSLLDKQSVMLVLLHSSLENGVLDTSTSALHILCLALHNFTNPN
jgi:hypothetical protein